MDDLSRQIDEIEALSSIYENEWQTVDQFSRTYKVSIASECGKCVIELQIKLPTNYPSESPPNYVIIAPWLRDSTARDKIRSKLDEIYSENLGEDIIFLWIEKVTEFLNENCKKSANNEDVVSVKPSFDVTQPISNIEIPEILHGDPFTDRKSTFQAHLCKVTKVKQVRLVLSELMKNRKIANASHNIMAYRISGQSTSSPNSQVILQDCDDDGESAAGGRMLHLLQILEVMDVMVVVSRWYGGILLGPDRFKHINNVTREILSRNGFVKEKKIKK